MDDATRNAAAFFDQHKAVYPLYEVFYEKLLAEFPDTRVKCRSRRFPTTTATSSPACRS